VKKRRVGVTEIRETKGKAVAENVGNNEEKERNTGGNASFWGIMNISLTE